nr:elongation factor G [bacterium]
MSPDSIRTVALIGHGGSGKTSLAEALLFTAGVTTRLGSVDRGTTMLDHEPEEEERKLSLNLSVASLEWDGCKINLIDTPGYADFSGDARSAIRVADLALFVVSGVDGVEVQTELMWKVAAEEGTPRAVFVTKLDRDRSSLNRTLDELREAFGKGIAPLVINVGEEAGLRGVARVSSGQVDLYEEGNPRGTAAPSAPEEVAAVLEEAHLELVESVVETDDDLMTAYFEGEEPEQAVIVSVIREAMRAGEIFPVLAGSSSQMIGIDVLADFLKSFAPSPLERPTPPLAEGSVEIAEDGAAAAYVFKTIGDPYVGRISILRVFSGSIQSDDTLELAGGQAVRVSNLFFLQGRNPITTDRILCGDVAAVAKVDKATTGSTLRSPGSDAVILPAVYPKPVMELAVFPRSTQDEEKLSTALQRAVEEDPTLAVERRSETGETILAGLGDVHLDVTLARINRKFGVEVDTALPKIAYRETITGRAEAEGKHKKQTGGRGQFGVAFVRFAPQAQGEGYEFIDSIKGGSIPRQYIPAVDKGIQEAFARGVLAGFPVIDVSAEVYDGKYHSVDSDELSFRMAGIAAVRAAAQELRPVLLEPITQLSVKVPEEYTGDVIGDINSKRGRVYGMDTDGSLRIISAEVPMAEIQRYAVDLRSMTSGRGTFEVAFDHYSEIPPQEAQKVINASRKDDN